MAVIETLLLAGTGSISVQVIGEFYDSVTRKGAAPLSPEAARTIAGSLLDVWPVFEITPAIASDAMRAAGRYRMRYYDALIWATARMNGVPYVLSEDGQDGQVIEGVQWLNPLVSTFDLDRLT